MSNELVIDDEAVYEQLLTYVRDLRPATAGKNHLYQDSDSRCSSVTASRSEINSAIDKKVWLRSGGYIIIETHRGPDRSSTSIPAAMSATPT